MRRIQTLVMMVMLIVGTVAVAPMAASAAHGSTGEAQMDGATMAQLENHTANNSTANDSATLSSGARLTGVISVQQTVLDGEFETRTFGVRVASAASNQSQAEIVAEQIGDIEDRLEELEQRKEGLREARENGSITESAFRAQMATLAYQTDTVQEQLTQAANVSEQLPEDVRQQQNINASAFTTLWNHTENVSSGEVYESAWLLTGDGDGDGDSDSRYGDSDEEDGNTSDQSGDGDGDGTTTTSDSSGDGSGSR